MKHLIFCGGVLDYSNPHELISTNSNGYNVTVIFTKDSNYSKLSGYDRFQNK